MEAVRGGPVGATRSWKSKSMPKLKKMMLVGLVGALVAGAGLTACTPPRLQVMLQTASLETAATSAASLASRT